MMELTNAIMREVKSLDTLKGRRETGLFKVEGTKMVLDTLGAFALKALYATGAWVEAHGAKLPAGVTPTMVRARDIERMSGVTTPQGVIAVYELPADDGFDATEAARSNLVLALDTIQDPGNLGTIMRMADWYGITTILCSPGCADAYSLKAVQSTMGAIARVRTHTCDLAAELKRMAGEGIRVYGTFLGGADIYTAPLTAAGVIVVGNEGHGISAEVAAAVTDRITIPPYPQGRATSESLNAAVAAAIAVSEFRRRM